MADKKVSLKSKVFAQFDKKQFYIGANDLNTFSAFSVTSSIETEDKKNGEKMPVATTKNIGVGEMSISIPLNEVYTDNSADKNVSKKTITTVRSEYEWWRNACNKGLTSYFYIGKKQVGNNRWKVVGCSLSDLIVNRDGTWRKCKVDITFKEYSGGISKKEVKKLKKKAGGLMKGKTTRTRKIKVKVKKASKAKTTKKNTKKKK